MTEQSNPSARVLYLVCANDISRYEFKLGAESLSWRNLLQLNSQFKEGCIRLLNSSAPPNQEDDDFLQQIVAALQRYAICVFKQPEGLLLSGDELVSVISFRGDLPASVTKAYIMLSTSEYSFIPLKPDVISTDQVFVPIESASTFVDMASYCKTAATRGLEWLDAIEKEEKELNFAISFLKSYSKYLHKYIIPQIRACGKGHFADLQNRLESIEALRVTNVESVHISFQEKYNNLLLDLKTYSDEIEEFSKEFDELDQTIQAVLDNADEPQFSLDQMAEAYTKAHNNARSQFRDTIVKVDELLSNPTTHTDNPDSFIYRDLYTNPGTSPFVLGAKSSFEAYHQECAKVAAWHRRVSVSQLRDSVIRYVDIVLRLPNRARDIEELHKEILTVVQDSVDMNSMRDILKQHVTAINVLKAQLGNRSDAPEPDAPEPDAPEPDAPEPDAPEPDASHQISDLLQKLNLMEEQHKQHLEECLLEKSQLENRLNETTLALQHCTSEKETLEEEIMLRSEQPAADNSDERLESELQQTQARVLAEEVESLKLQLANAQTTQTDETHDLQQQIVSLTAEVKALKAKGKDLDGRAKFSRKQFLDADSELRACKSELVKLKQQLDSAPSYATVASSQSADVEAANKLVTTLEGELSQRTAQVEALKEQNAQLATDASNLDVKVIQYQGQIADLTTSLEATRATATQLVNELEPLKQELRTKNERIVLLEDELRTAVSGDDADSEAIISRLKEDRDALRRDNRRLVEEKQQLLQHQQDSVVSSDAAARIQLLEDECSQLHQVIDKEVNRRLAAEDTIEHFSARMMELERQLGSEQEQAQETTASLHQQFATIMRLEEELQSAHSQRDQEILSQFVADNVVLDTTQPPPVNGTILVERVEPPPGRAPGWKWLGNDSFSVSMDSAHAINSRAPSARIVAVKVIYVTASPQAGHHLIECCYHSTVAE
jgi:predicted  nucleic acid-binding Zn-ribbon protein